MSNYYLEKDHGTSRILSMGTFSMIFVFVVLLGSMAFPLPAIIANLSLGSKLAKFKERQRLLPDLLAYVEELRILASHRITLTNRMNKALPEVESLLVLRNLLLAQAQATGVDLDLLESSPPTPFSLCGESVGALTMVLKGMTETRNFILFIGLMEATGLVYRIDSIDASFSLDDVDKVTFNINLEVYFRGDRSLFGTAFNEHSMKHQGSEGENDAHQP